jgi:hypothetical protein
MNYCCIFDEKIDLQLRAQGAGLRDQIFSPYWYPECLKVATG